MRKSIVKFFTKKELIHANNAAIREKRNKALNEDFLNSLSDDGKYAEAYSIYHTKDEIRVNILFDDKGTSGFLDMSLNRYELVRTAIMFEDGTIEYPEYDKKQPYPNEREWEEKVVRKPVRKQGRFRKDVLKAYNNQCAVCSINTPALLRAAHIIPVVEDNDDTVNNGICLCVLHEVAFDRGDLLISPNGEIEIKNNQDLKVDYNNIRLPDSFELRPSTEKIKLRYEKYKQK